MDKRPYSFIGATLKMPEYLFDSNWIQLLKGNNIFIFFDFDGTLVPIKKNPEDCYLSYELKKSLQELKNKIKIGIISGRDLENLKRRISIRGIYYSGSHGLQIESSEIKYINPDAQRLKPYINEISREVKKLANRFLGTLIEKKNFSFALHYRQLDTGKRKELKKLFFDIISNYNQDYIKILNGKMVFEVLPAVNWNKANAVSFLINSTKSEHFPIFIGDDITDEAVFGEIKDRGLTIKVGYSKKTMAKYFIRNQREIYKLIKNIKEALNA